MDSVPRSAVLLICDLKRDGVTGFESGKRRCFGDEFAIFEETHIPNGELFGFCGSNLFALSNNPFGAGVFPDTEEEVERYEREVPNGLCFWVQR